MARHGPRLAGAQHPWPGTRFHLFTNLIPTPWTRPACRPRSGVHAARTAKTLSPSSHSPRVACYWPSRYRHHAPRTTYYAPRTRRADTRVRPYDEMARPTSHGPQATSQELLFCLPRWGRWPQAGGGLFGEVSSTQYVVSGRRAANRHRTSGGSCGVKTLTPALPEGEGALAIRRPVQRIYPDH